MTRIDLVTGILGSGKTTWIKKYASYFIEKGQRIAILENDFGAVNVDMMLLQELAGPKCHLEMVLGGGDPDCHRRRFKSKLIALGMQGFDRVIVEPSGIFDVDEFLDLLQEDPLDRWFELGTILTLVDSDLEESLSTEMEFLLASQVANSGKLVMSKIDQLKQEGLKEEEIKERVNHTLAHINQSLESIKCFRRITEKTLFCKDWNLLTGEDLEGLSQAGYQLYAYEKNWSLEGASSSTHYFLHVSMKEEQLKGLLQEMRSDSSCGKIFRVKGFFKGETGWVEVNATRKKTEIHKINQGQEIFIVIGEGLNKEALDRKFQTVNTNDQYESI